MSSEDNNQYIETIKTAQQTNIQSVVVRSCSFLFLLEKRVVRCLEVLRSAGESALNVKTFVHMSCMIIVVIL